MSTGQRSATGRRLRHLQYEDVRAGNRLSEEFIAALQAMIETVGRFRFRVQDRPRTAFA